MRFFFLIGCLFGTALADCNHVPIAIVENPGPKYSLVNSVDYHPSEQLFCITYTHNNKIILYRLNAEGNPEEVQCLSNPSAELSAPQHAAFSPDGKTITVANWDSQTLTIYQREGSLFRETPVAVFPQSNFMSTLRPHGITFSPCGNYLAIAYGASINHGRAVALYRVKNDSKHYKFVFMLQNEDLPGIPKGVVFSPDGTCLLVTFSDVHSLVVYNLYENKQRIEIEPRQVIQGVETKISRPEDVKITADGKLCAVSNSDCSTVTFYPYDAIANRLTQTIPCEVLANPEANFYFPHGIAFSPDGKYMVITQFGLLEASEEGNVLWEPTKPADYSKFNVYRMQ